MVATLILKNEGGVSVGFCQYIQINYLRQADNRFVQQGVQTRLIM